MKKLFLWVLVAIALLMAVKNPKIHEYLSTEPQQIWRQLIAHIEGVTDYKPENFLASIDAAKLPLTQREQRYVRNISKSSSDLLLFYKRYCIEPDTSHLVLDDTHLAAVCSTISKTLLLE